MVKQRSVEAGEFKKEILVERLVSEWRF